jgi:hypothetical protein
VADSCVGEAVFRFPTIADTLNNLATTDPATTNFFSRPKQLFRREPRLETLRRRSKGVETYVPEQNRKVLGYDHFVSKERHWGGYFLTSYSRIDKSLTLSRPCPQDDDLEAFLYTVLSQFGQIPLP